MKKFLLFISGALFAFGANAQVSKFEGASANVALAYQSYSWDEVSAVTLAGNILTATHSASKGLVGKIGLDYTWRLSEENFLAIGFDYAMNGGGYGSADIRSQGATVNTAQLETKQKLKVFIAPSTMINSDMLGYFKLGYSQYHSRWQSDGETANLNAITYGVGAKFMASDSSFFFAEANMLSGLSMSYIDSSGGTVKAKPKGSEILVGYGIKF